MIEIWKEIVIENPGAYVGWVGLLIGTVFGYIVYVTNFCTMGSISDILSFGDYRRFRSWLLAGAVGMIGILVLQSLDVANFADSMFLSTNFNFSANIVGGLLFGFGMVFSGGCISRNLVRAGSGDLRSLVVLLITGLFGYMPIGGLVAPARVAIFGPLNWDLTALNMETQGVGEFVSVLTGLGTATGFWIAFAAIVGGILVYCFKDSQFRSSPVHLIAGIGIGLCVVAGWMITGLAQDDFTDQPVTLISLSYKLEFRQLLPRMQSKNLQPSQAQSGLKRTHLHLEFPYPKRSSPNSKVRKSQPEPGRPSHRWSCSQIGQ